MNIVIKSSKVTKRDLECVFNSEKFCFAESLTIDSLCKELGVYKSTSDARRAGREGRVPTGYSEIKASKKITLFIWNPDEFPEYEYEALT
jgi:hypothetical protein